MFYVFYFVALLVEWLLSPRMETKLLLWRAETIAPLLREPMVNWFRATTETEARKLWREEATACRVDVSKVTMTLRQATADECVALGHR